MLDEAFARGWENSVGRWYGPRSLRLLVQPAVAILSAIRAGQNGTRRNESPFLWAVLSNPRSPRAQLRNAWTDVRAVCIVGLIWDSRGPVMRIAT
jgi:hypothetical protein